MMLFSTHIERRGYFSWVAYRTEAEFIDRVNQRRLTAMIWHGSKSRGFKHIWVRRLKNGALRVAPGLDVNWAPLTSGNNLDID